VADETKPPESMVQFTVAVNAGEYDRWRNETSALSQGLRENVAEFFNEELGSIVRWLPGEPFSDQQSEDNMSHEAMDSWYLHHALFNVFRIAHEGDAAAKDAFRKSLAYLIRVAHRFDYRWPIFFDLKTLDVIRAEATPGAGGETDVAGLYALVMIHAHEMFGDPTYLEEAEAAAAHLRGFGFHLAYQLNTTGFAAEAALRLWKTTKNAQYLALSETCMANLFDNMWLWRCDYGNARHYRTFGGSSRCATRPTSLRTKSLKPTPSFTNFSRSAATTCGRPSNSCWPSIKSMPSTGAGTTTPTRCRSTCWPTRCATAASSAAFPCRLRISRTAAKRAAKSAKSCTVRDCRSS